MERELGRERVRVAIMVACGAILLIVLFLLLAPPGARTPGSSRTPTAVAVATHTPLHRVSLGSLRTMAGRSYPVIPP